jgi:hypothetical protein
VTAPLRRRRVRLRCARCRRQFGPAIRLVNGEFIIDVDERHLDLPATTLGYTAVQCKCGFRPAVNTASVDRAARKAWELGMDLMVGAPNFGLPR